MQIISIGDNLHEMSNPILREQNKKNVINLSSAELAQQVLKVNYTAIYTYSREKSHRTQSYIYQPEVKGLAVLRGLGDLLRRVGLTERDRERDLGPGLKERPLVGLRLLLAELCKLQKLFQAISESNKQTQQKQQLLLVKNSLMYYY